MKMNFNCVGKDARKQLVKDIAELTGNPSKYLGMPSMAYSIGHCTVDRNGIVEIDEKAYREEAERIAEGLMEKGYEGEAQIEAGQGTAEPVDADGDEPSKLVIAFPRDKLSDAGIERLRKLLDAKGSLIKKALGIENVSINVEEDRVTFPWFKATSDFNELNAYSRFICALCAFAEKQTRVTAKEKQVDNEKFAFRTFLLRLGFIGDEPEMKAARKVLLSRLNGSSAFKSGKKKESATREEE